MGFNRNYLDGIRKAIDNIQRYLAVTRDEFLADEMRQHAVAYQYCLWTLWAKLLGGQFSQLHPLLDMRDTFFLSPSPNWKSVWDSREQLPSLERQIEQLIASEREESQRA